MIAVIDNRDSFTFNLVQELQGLGAEVCVYRSADARVQDVLRPEVQGVLIGPGPGEPGEAGSSEEIVRARAAASDGPPVLGVCLGLQALGTALGAQLRQASELVHGATRDITHSGQGLFEGLEHPFPMARYNSLVIDEPTLPDVWRVTGRTEDGDIAALEHRSLPMMGVQGHPESILSVHAGGRRLLKNFLTLTGHP